MLPALLAISSQFPLNQITRDALDVSIGGVSTARNPFMSAFLPGLQASLNATNCSLRRSNFEEKILLGASGPILKPSFAICVPNVSITSSQAQDLAKILPESPYLSFYVGSVRRTVGIAVKIDQLYKMYASYVVQIEASSFSSGQISFFVFAEDAIEPLPGRPFAVKFQIEVREPNQKSVQSFNNYERISWIAFSVVLVLAAVFITKFRYNRSITSANIKRSPFITFGLMNFIHTAFLLWMYRSGLAIDTAFFRLSFPALMIAELLQSIWSSVFQVILNEKDYFYPSLMQFLSFLVPIQIANLAASFSGCQRGLSIFELLTSDFAWLLTAFLVGRGSGYITKYISVKKSELPEGIIPSKKSISSELIAGGLYLLEFAFIAAPLIDHFNDVLFGGSSINVNFVISFIALLFCSDAIYSLSRTAIKGEPAVEMSGLIGTHIASSVLFCVMFAWKLSYLSLQLSISNVLFTIVYAIWLCTAVTSIGSAFSYCVGLLAIIPLVPQSKML